MKTIEFEGKSFTVGDEYKWITRDIDGAVYAHIELPHIKGRMWLSLGIMASIGNLNITQNWGLSLQEIKK